MSAGWFTVIALTLARATMAFQFQLVPALAPGYRDEFGLGYAAFGALAVFGTTAALSAAPGLAALGLVLLAAVWRSPEGAAPPSATRRRARMAGSDMWLVPVSGTLWAIYKLAFIALMDWMPQALIGEAARRVGRCARQRRGVVDPAVRHRGRLACQPRAGATLSRS